jgi:type VI secretion system secreted protein Hcp
MVFARRVLGIGIGILLLAATLAGKAQAADDYFLKIDGIDGEARDKGHTRWIDLVSVGWGAGVARGIVANCTPGRDCHGYASAEETTIIRHPDKTSALLLQAKQVNRILPTVLIHQVHDGAVVGTYTLQDAQITAIGPTGANDQLTLRFQRVEWSHSAGKSSQPR